MQLLLPLVAVGVGVRVIVRVGVRVEVAVVKPVVGVQVGAWVGAGSEADMLLLLSLLSVITFVESAVAVTVPGIAPKLSVTDWPAARPFTVCVCELNDTINVPALAVPLLLTTTLSRGLLVQAGVEPTYVILVILRSGNEPLMGVLVNVAVRVGVFVIARGVLVLVGVLVGLEPQPTSENSAGTLGGSQVARVVWACRTL